MSSANACSPTITVKQNQQWYKAVAWKQRDEKIVVP